jgi:hypothetical protein
MALTKETIKRLKAVREAILMHPELYDQKVYFGSKNDPCGTSCCIAGWAVWLDSPEKFLEGVSDYFFDWRREASKSLRFPELRCSGLFGTGRCWLENAYQMLCNEKTPKQRALAAATAIDDLIENGASW